MAVALVHWDEDQVDVPQKHLGLLTNPLEGAGGSVPVGMRSASAVGGADGSTPCQRPESRASPLHILVLVPSFVPVERVEEEGGEDVQLDRGGVVPPGHAAGHKHRQVAVDDLVIQPDA